MKNNKLLFYALSFTWGLPMTLVGVVAALIMLLLFRKPELCGYCIRFRIGNGWGGVSLGLTIITDNQSESEITYHEHGHAIQNALYGFIMPFIRGLLHYLFGFLPFFNVPTDKRNFFHAFQGISDKFCPKPEAKVREI